MIKILNVIIKILIVIIKIVIIKIVIVLIKILIAIIKCYSLKLFAIKINLIIATLINNAVIANGFNI